MRKCEGQARMRGGLGVGEGLVRMRKVLWKTSARVADTLESLELPETRHIEYLRARQKCRGPISNPQVELGCCSFPRPLGGRQPADEFLFKNSR